MSFAPNSLPVDLTVSTLEDSVPEGVEVIELLLSNPQPTGAVRGLLALVLLEDDEPGQAGLFQLRLPSGTSWWVDVAEQQGSASFRVLRVGGSSGGATVDFAAIAASSGFVAVAGRDYVAATGTLVFADGVTERTFSIPVLDDSEIATNGAWRPCASFATATC